jgi:SpoIID/LytB domain protein
MRTGPRLLFAALVAGALAVPAAPAAQAKGSGSGKKSSTSAKTPKVPALATDVARIEPLARPGATTAPTVTLEGVGEYRGLLEIRRAGGGVGAVNEVALDDYLKGISEVPSSWPSEVLRAQAIAARTYLLWTLASGAPGAAAALGAQICATESCQVYSGVAKERAPNGERWAAAVHDTSGLALLSGGAPILAKYSACNGGRSVSGGKPYLKVIDDPDDAKCPLHRWGLAVSYDDIGRALAVPGSVKSVRATPGDVVVGYSADGGGGEVTVPRTAFRARVGAAVPPPSDRSRTVPSIMFTLRPDDGSRIATLDGRGFGHAIGMSQWGAYGKALRGMKAGAILAAYYGGIGPAKVPAAKLPAKVRVAVDDGKPPTPPAAKPGAVAAGPAENAGGAKTKAGQDPKAAKAGTAPATAGAADAVVSASGPFRILDAKGGVVVPVATGSWRVIPAGKGLKLLPPRDQAGAAGLTVLGIEPAAPLPGQPITVRFKSNLPAILSASAQSPGAPEAAPVLAAQVAGTDERRLTLPAAPQPGPYAVTLSADAGPGRTATLTVTPAVLDPNAPPPAPPGTPGDPRPGLLGIPSDAKLFEGSLAQALLTAPPTPISADRASSLGRVSRSAPRRPLGSSRTAPLSSDQPLPGLLLAALGGLGFWRLGTRAAPPALPAPDMAPETGDPSAPAP